MAECPLPHCLRQYTPSPKFFQLLAYPSYGMKKELTESEIRRRIITCVRCDLSSRAGVRPVPWHGPIPARIAIVGEAPGLQENIQGRPFVDAGASGRLLRRELDANGVIADECCIMNTASCFPGRAPTVAQQRACRVHLQRQLKLASPEYILVLGAIALNFFDPDQRITNCHGQSWLSKWGTVFPTFHPAAALRDPAKHAEFREDIRAFATMVALT